jgi:hypothetical protein
VEVVTGAGALAEDEEKGGNGRERDQVSGSRSYTCHPPCARRPSAMDARADGGRCRDVTSSQGSPSLACFGQDEDWQHLQDSGPSPHKRFASNTSTLTMVTAHEARSVATTTAALRPLPLPIAVLLTAFLAIYVGAECSEFTRAVRECSLHASWWKPLESQIEREL